jgi:uncharacterized protein YPO0396
MGPTMDSDQTTPLSTQGNRDMALTGSVRRTGGMVPLFGLLLLALPAAAGAQATSGPQQAPAEARAALDTLISTMNFTYVACPLRISTVALQARTQILRREEVDVQAVLAAQLVCPDSMRGVAESLFNRARTAPVSSEAGALLRDVYAFFRANLVELHPRSLEEATSNRGEQYDTRISAIRQTLREKLERLRIEL